MAEQSDKVVEKERNPLHLREQESLADSRDQAPAVESLSVANDAESDSSLAATDAVVDESINTKESSFTTKRQSVAECAKKDVVPKTSSATTNSKKGSFIGLGLFYLLVSVGVVLFIVFANQYCHFQTAAPLAKRIITTPRVWQLESLSGYGWNCPMDGFYADQRAKHVFEKNRSETLETPTPSRRLASI